MGGCTHTAEKVSSGVIGARQSMIVSRSDTVRWPGV